MQVALPVASVARGTEQVIEGAASSRHLEVTTGAQAASGVGSDADAVAGAGSVSGNTA